MMNERAIEKYLVKQVESNGGICRKWVSPGRRGVPDRICIFPFNLILFVECKYGKNYLSSLQKLEVAQLRKLGCEVFIVSTKEEIDTFIITVKIRMILQK